MDTQKYKREGKLGDRKKSSRQIETHQVHGHRTDLQDDMTFTVFKFCPDFPNYCGYQMPLHMHTYKTHGNTNANSHVPTRLDQQVPV